MGSAGWKKRVSLGVFSQLVDILEEQLTDPDAAAVEFEVMMLTAQFLEQVHGAEDRGGWKWAD
jgi:hypothetical protein